MTKSRKIDEKERIKRKIRKRLAKQLSNIQVKFVKPEIRRYELKGSFLKLVK